MATMSLQMQDHFAHLTMHNEGRFNLESLAEINDLLDAIENDENAKAVLISGEQKYFAHGLDLETLLEMKQTDFYQFVENTMVMVARLLTFPIPVVAVVNGHAFGLGAMIALASDYRVMRADRGFVCLPEIDLGMPFIPTMAALVTNKLSGSLRRDMLLAGRRLGGQEAYDEGLVDACGNEGELLDLAKQVVEPALGKKRETMAAIKRDINLPIVEAIESGSGVRGSADSVW